MDREDRERLQEELTRLADGDRSAFHPVFVRLRPILRDLARRHLGAAEAEDVAQQALLKVFLRASEFDPGRDALAWVAGIGVWEIRTFRRRASRRREAPIDSAGLEAIPHPGEDPEEAALRELLGDRLHRAIGRLRPADAQTLLAYAHGLAGSTRGAAFRKRVQRALERLRRQWRSLYGEP